MTSSNTTTVGSNPAPSTDVSSGGLQPDIHSFISEDILSQKLPASLNKRFKRRETSVRVGGRVAETGNQHMSGGNQAPMDCNELGNVRTA